METIRYTSEYCEAWDALVRTSRNGNFLFERQFMDYHADRFVDVSLLFVKNGKILGALPCTEHGDIVVSHGGLTYGGLLLSPSAHAVDARDMLQLAADYYRAEGYKSLRIKPIPSIYHSQPTEEELYWLFRKDATLTARSLSSAIDLSAPLPFSTLRKRKLSKARKNGLLVFENIALDAKEHWARFWEILTQVLQVQHSKIPVHSLAEIRLLKARFPREIQLWGVLDGANLLIAGTILFVSKTVVHAQYIASSTSGKETGALDLLFNQIVETYSHSSSVGSLRFLDFGISTEDSGAYLNEGLIFQKEGFGARSVVYDAYTLTL